MKILSITPIVLGASILIQEEDTSKVSTQKPLPFEAAKDLAAKLEGQLKCEKAGHLYFVCCQNEIVLAVYNDNNTWPLNILEESLTERLIVLLGERKIVLAINELTIVSASMKDNADLYPYWDELRHAVLSTPISETELDGGTKKVLKDQKLIFLGDLVELEYDAGHTVLFLDTPEIIRLKGVRKARFDMIEKMLESFGLEYLFRNVGWVRP